MSKQSSQKTTQGEHANDEEVTVEIDLNEEQLHIIDRMVEARIIACSVFDLVENERPTTDMVQFVFDRVFNECVDYDDDTEHEEDN